MEFTQTPEYKLQTATADYVHGRIYKGIKLMAHVQRPFPLLKFHHSANEGRSETEGAKFKRRGVMAGITDWLIWGPNRWHGMIELKAPGKELNRLHGNQATVSQWAQEYGFPHAVCRSVAEMRDTLIGWGHKCQNMACIEPDYLTKYEKFQSVHEMYRP